MPIPAFDSILNVLPPHLGDPRDPSQMSPFPCTIMELVDRFSTSPERKAILDGFLRLRQEFLTLGIVGVQWIDGSFLEDIEAEENRAPKDIDVLTFVANQLDLVQLQQVILAKNPNLLNRNFLKATYSVDHFLLPLGSDPWNIVANTKYFYGLFSHRRDRMWKGMLEMEMADAQKNTDAHNHLRTLP
jgi:hypothetical protein